MQRFGHDLEFFLSLMLHDAAPQAFGVFMNMMPETLNDGEPDGVRGQD